MTTTATPGTREIEQSETAEDSAVAAAREVDAPVVEECEMTDVNLGDEPSARVVVAAQPSSPVVVAAQPV